MFKVAVLTLALFSAVLAETTFEEVPKGARTFVTKPGDAVSHPEGYSIRDAQNFATPSDNGGNWGDNIWGKRVAGDALISREIQINAISPTELQFNWKANFPGKQISHIRILNIGRQRAYVPTITGNHLGSTANAVVQVAPNLQFRIIIEIFAK